jgi:hypothetical protein
VLDGVLDVLPSVWPQAHQLEAHATTTSEPRVFSTIAGLMELQALVDVGRVAAVVLATHDALIEMQQVHAAHNARPQLKEVFACQNPHLP